MHLVIIELDGLIADYRHRLEAAQKVGHPASGAYWKQFYDPVLIAQDPLVPGSAELLHYLTAHQWRVVLVTKRTWMRSIHDATVSWLAAQGFDAFTYQLKMKDTRFTRMPYEEWKAVITHWFTSEGEPHSGYQRVALVEPERSSRLLTLAYWSTMHTGINLETYARFLDFSQQLPLGKYRAELEPLLAAGPTFDQDDDGEQEEENTALTHPAKMVIFPRSDEDPSMRRAPDKPTPAQRGHRTYTLAHLD